MSGGEVLMHPDSELNLSGMRVWVGDASGKRVLIEATDFTFEVGTVTVGPVRPRFSRSYILDGDGPGGLFIPRRIDPAKRRRSRRRARRDRRGW